MWGMFAKKGMEALGGGGGGTGNSDEATKGMWRSGLDSYQDMSSTPMGLMDASAVEQPEKPMFTGAGMDLGGYQDQPQYSDEEADGMFGWMKKKYPEMAEMGTAEQLAFLKAKGAIGSGQYHGMGQANSLGQSQGQGANMMSNMQGLMNQAMGAGGQPNRKQIEIGLMGGGQPQQNPWGLMGG